MALLFVNPNLHQRAAVYTMAIVCVRRDDDWQDAFRRMMEDFQFLAGRPEESTFVQDVMQQIHYRRRWVEEREEFERTRQSDARK